MAQAVQDYLRYTEQRSQLSRFLLLALPILFAGFMVNLAGNVLWMAAQANAAFPRMTKHLIAALVEPTTTKLAPAIAIAVYLRQHDGALVDRVRRRYLLMAVVFGVLAGGLEFGLYLFKGVLVSMVVPLPLSAVIICRAPPIVMHTVTGALVAAPVFSLIDYSFGDRVTRFNMNRLLAIMTVAVPLFLLAQLVHVWWNTGGATIVMQSLGLACN